MLKKIVSLAVSAVMMLALTGCSLVAQDVIEKENQLEVPPHMVFLGDSIAAGYGLDGYTSTDNYNCDSYSNLLEKKYSQELSGICSPEMQNFAVSGATSDDLLELLDSGKLDSALENADVVVVSIGGNDMLHKMYGLLADLGMSEDNQSIDPDNIHIISALSKLITLEGDMDKALDGFEVNINKISDTLNEKSSGQIYIQTLYNPFQSLTDFRSLFELSENKIARFNEIVNENANGYKVIDIAEKFDGKTDKLTRIGKLDIHPNEEGHRLIADIVDASFREESFTYTTTEYGEPYLTRTAIILIIIGVCAMVAVLIIIPKLFKKHEESNN